MSKEPEVGTWECESCGMSGDGLEQVIAHLREHVEIEVNAAHIALQPISGFPIFIKYTDHQKQS